MQSNFGAGYLFALPPGGGTPRMFAAAQDSSVDLKYDMKMLYGQKNFPIEQARGKGTLDIKITTGRIDPDLFNAIFFNATSTLGEILTALGESVNVPASTPYTKTVANAANFKVDLGVFDVATGRWLDRVASAPAAGQYAVNSTTGVYTFAAADAGMVRKAYYTYSSDTTGKTTIITNQTMDAAPTFRLILTNKYNGKTLGMDFPKVQASALSFPFNLDDFTLPAFTASAQADDSDTVFTMNVTG